MEVWVSRSRGKASFGRDWKGFRICSQLQRVKLHDGKIDL